MAWREARLGFSACARRPSHSPATRGDGLAHLDCFLSLVASERFEGCHLLREHMCHDHLPSDGEANAQGEQPDADKPLAAGMRLRRPQDLGHETGFASVPHSFELVV